MLSTVQSGSILLLKPTVNPETFWGRLRQRLVNLTSSIPVVNSISPAADCANWHEAVCLINYQKQLHVIVCTTLNNEMQLCMDTVDNYCQTRSLNGYIIRRLHSSLSEKERIDSLLAAMRSLQDNIGQSGAKWQIDPNTLTADLYAKAFHIAIDTSDVTMTSAQMFATGGLLDEAMFAVRSRFVLAPEELHTQDSK